MALWRVLEYAKLKLSRVSIVRTLAGMDGGFAVGKESRLTFCWQADNGFSRTCAPHLHLQSKYKYGSKTPSLAKQKGHRFGVLLFWLGWMGSNHRNARVKVWCLTAWLHPNIALVLYHILF